MILVEFFCSRSLFYTNNLDVKSFMPAPKLVTSGNYGDLNFSVVGNVYLIFKYTTGNRFGTYNDTSRKYTMSVNNFRKTRRCFATAVRWFEDPSYSNLFYYAGEDELLELNMEMKDISAVVTMSKRNLYAMEIKPVVIEDNMGRREGVSLTINRSENTVFLDWEEFIVLADIVLNFDFRQEALLLLNSYKIAYDHGNITTPQGMKTARDIDRGQRRDPFSQS